jgi:hypothetical protein
MKLPHGFEILASKYPARVTTLNIAMKLPPHRALYFRRLRRGFGKLLFDQQHCQALVGVLTALCLHLDTDTGRKVCGTYGRIRFVNVLSARPRGTTGFEADFTHFSWRWLGMSGDTDKPVFSTVMRSKRTGANPPHGPAPSTSKLWRSLAIERQQCRKERSSDIARHKFDHVDVDRARSGLVQQTAKRLGDRQRTFPGTACG